MALEVKVEVKVQVMADDAITGGPCTIFFLVHPCSLGFQLLIYVILETFVLGSLCLVSSHKVGSFDTFFHDF